ncbi:glycosyltransferase family A protein [Flavobacterium cerinum]|uniref:Glycosyltransferase family 2 protein n=1 Tax=Flavobacterium cerinum TaxID=2502784 RepID=A0ABY5IX86_9FLAO|nr:glycosyltransferase family 2 protein [Flavobacterium cerinum]UUC47036.1 glycosyltransferase family 2 protein [Flavobacterium cerinum]
MLAIVIPYYKIAFFDQTLLSLANQTDKRFKVYIGDDASPDDPSELLSRFEDRVPFYYHRFATNKGGSSLVEQWNRCVGLTAGEEWIMILGDDDMLSENVVANWYRDFEAFEGKSNVVRFASQLIYEQNKTFSKVFTHPVWEKASDACYRKMKGKTRSSLSEYIFTKEVYTKYGFYNYPLAWYSDDRAWVEFTEEKAIYAINDSVVLVRISEENISGQTNNKAEKTEAWNQYAKGFLLKNLWRFKKQQRFRLLLEYEMAAKEKGKMTKAEWFSLIALYIKEMRFLPFVKVIRRFVLDL